MVRGKRAVIIGVAVGLATISVFITGLPYEPLEAVAAELKQYEPTATATSEPTQAPTEAPLATATSPSTETPAPTAQPEATEADQGGGALGFSSILLLLGLGVLCLIGVGMLGFALWPMIQRRRGA